MNRAKEPRSPHGSPYAVEPPKTKRRREPVGFRTGNSWRLKYSSRFGLVRKTGTPRERVRWKSGGAPRKPEKISSLDSGAATPRSRRTPSARRRKMIVEMTERAAGGTRGLRPLGEGEPRFAGRSGPVPDAPMIMLYSGFCGGAE
jgi:hypothetical protein